jgi:hypothetical protein
MAWTAQEQQELDEILKKYPSRPQIIRSVAGVVSGPAREELARR